MKTHTTTLLTFGALATSLLLAGCGQQSKPAPAAAAADAAACPTPADAVRRRGVLRYDFVHHAGRLCLVCR